MSQSIAVPDPAADSSEDIVEILFDTECPVCTAYCTIADVRNNAGQVSRIDARKDSALVREATERSLDLDEGMIVKYRGEIYHGSDAIHILALLNPRETLFDKLTYAMFKSRRRTAIIYPAMKAGRSLLLRLLGRKRIGNLEQS